MEEVDLGTERLEAREDKTQPVENISRLLGVEI